MKLAVRECRAEVADTARAFADEYLQPALRVERITTHRLAIAARKRIAAEISRKAYELVPYIHFSQWRNPVAYRSDRLSGVIVTPSLPPMWNIEKK